MFSRYIKDKITTHTIPKTISHSCSECQLGVRDDDQIRKTFGLELNKTDEHEIIVRLKNWKLVLEVEYF